MRDQCKIGFSEKQEVGEENENAVVEGSGEAKTTKKKKRKHRKMQKNQKKP